MYHLYALEYVFHEDFNGFILKPITGFGPYADLHGVEQSLRSKDISEIDHLQVVALYHPSTLEMARMKKFTRKS